MAPEVINQNKYGKKADIWSLGCALIEMLTAKNPWDNMFEDNYINALYTIGKSNGVPQLTVGSKEMKDFVNACLHRDWKARPRASELLNHDFMLLDTS